MARKPIVAIVGRPNVGKSALFNKLVGKRLSIVEDVPGVTRDRLYADTDWNGRTFTLADTGGIEPKTDSEILQFMRVQAEAAVETADVIILVTDIHSGVTAADQDVANYLLRSKKPIVLAVNKMDSTGYDDPDIYDFLSLGVGTPVAVSATHGHGTGDLLDVCVKYFNDPLDNSEEDDRIKVAVIGKPNVGKSSLINRVLGEKRVIVSEVAGTTRDAVDTPFSNEFGDYLLIDTAGIRKHSKVDERVERFSVMRAEQAIERADVCLIMVDAQEGVTEQDTKIAGLAHESGKASVILANKWDLVKNEKLKINNEKLPDNDDYALAFMSYAPVLTISAATGLRVNKLFELINYVHSQSVMRITTGLLNNVLSDATMRVQPPTDKGKRLKLLYMTQTGIQPPHFVVFCNDKSLFHFSYQRYIENQIRAAFGLDGTPIRMTARNRGEN
ncbi:MAG: ribosome biogenesis GTPase Der [Oscillospiraceae bacterium]|jgi:GTP-binding protein|nr:ribosome biogenesis GTPase Der [Oscillospiraceae bacterium]